MSQGTSRRNRNNYLEEAKGIVEISTDPGYRSRSVRICVQALTSILEVMDEMDVAKLNKAGGGSGYDGDDERREGSDEDK
nr:12011_t:CDS:2 [Entrophospora candida]